MARAFLTDAPSCLYATLKKFLQFDRLEACEAYRDHMLVAYDEMVGREQALAANQATCTLFQHLAGVVVSDISHCLTSTERRLTVRAPRANGSTSWPPEVADGAPDQEHLAVWISEQRRLLDHLHRLDPLMGRMAELMLVHDLCETSELSPALELGPVEVANLRKRLKRAVRTYLLEAAS